MKEYRVEWTDYAKLDVSCIIEYIQKDSPTTAKSIFLEIKEQGNSLNTMPLRHRIVPELQHLGITSYREVIYKRWRVIYRVSQDSVFIVAIFDTARNLEDIIFERLLR